MTHRMILRSALASVGFAIAVALAGCAPQQPDYDPGTAELLQAEVLEVSQLSADADFAGAMLILSDLELDLKDARARGLITEERYESIMSALAVVRTDLEAAIAALTPPAPAPDPAPAPEGGGGDDDDDDDDEGNGNEGKGNEGKDNGNKGKGNGNDD